MGGAVVVAFMIGTQVLFKLPRTVEEPLFYLAFAALPAAIGIAILKHDLYDIELALSRTLVWDSLTAFVVGSYVVVVGFVGTLVHDRGDLVPSLIATGVVALLFRGFSGSSTASSTAIATTLMPWSLVWAGGLRQRWRRRGCCRRSWRLSPRC